MRTYLENLKSHPDRLFRAYDVNIAQFAGRVRVDLAAHFDYDKAGLRDEDKPALDDFVSVIKQHPDTIITVEGFTGAAGSVAYNKKLGQERADAVRDSVIQTGGVAANKVRAVRYGKGKQRQYELGT